MTPVPGKKLAVQGKPIAALRVLAGASRPLREGDVWSALTPSWPEGTMWHQPLATLTRLGLAERTGKPGGYQFEITPRGRATVAAAAPLTGWRMVTVPDA